jgi:hypothetical protein
MGRSPGFGSTLTDSGACAPGALFGLGFPAAASLRRLNLPANVTRRFILQKARRHPSTRLSGSDCLGAVGFRFSFTPLPGCFSPFPHGTGTLSVARSIEPWRVVPPDSPRVSRVPGYLGGYREPLTCSLPDCHRLWCRFPADFVCVKGFLLAGRTAVRPGNSHNPHCATPAGLTRSEFGLVRFRSPLLTESRLISVPRGTKMFQFPRFPSPYGDLLPSRRRRCRIRASPDQSVLAAPRGVSPYAAPFIGSWPQGIHPPPNVA